MTADAIDETVLNPRVSAQAVHALEVPGFRAAAFVTPDAPGQRPVVIGLHGNFDRPEWMCAAWARIVAGRRVALLGQCRS